MSAELDHKSLKTAFYAVERKGYAGYIYNLGTLYKKYTVDILVDGAVISSIYCDAWVHDLAAAGIGDGCFGFTFVLPDEVARHARTLDVRLANVGSPVGPPISLSRPHGVGEAARQLADVQWLGGLRFDGWLSHDIAGQAVDVWVDEQLVTSVRPVGWTHVQHGAGITPLRRLDFYVPERFADGRAHVLSIRDSGRSLTSVLPFVAFADGLAATLEKAGRWESEKLRGRLFDRLLPMSLPLSCYEDWQSSFPQPRPMPKAEKVAVVMIGEQNIGETLASLDLQVGIEWTAISLNTNGITTFSCFDALRLLDEEAGDCAIALFCLSGTILRADALAALAWAFPSGVAPHCVYPDVDIRALQGRAFPLALPALDQERMLEQGYAAHLFATRRADAVMALGEEASSLYELCQLCFAAAGMAGVHHLPGARATLPEFDVVTASRELARATRSSLSRHKEPASVAEMDSTVFPAVRVTRSHDPRERTTVIIPTRNRTELLRKCVTSILPGVERCDAGIVIMDNDSADPETLDYLAHIRSDRIDVIRAPGPFNFSHINNLAVRKINSDNLCFLNNDIEAHDDLWLSELLSRLSGVNVGAVGAKLVWPTGVVQHAGVVLGPAFSAEHVFNDRMDGDPGYADMLLVARETSAVTAACLVMRKADYVAIGGMDEIHFPVNFNDLDLCLKLRCLGRRIVVTPHARLLHDESASRGRDEAPDRKGRFQRELRMLRTIWGDALLNDPYYSPLLSLDQMPYSALAWPPRGYESRVNEIPRRLMVPAGI